MFSHNWLILPTLVGSALLFCHISGVNGQSQNAIGAHRVYQKTSFSCTGRPSGYYADIETGCQVYHMCDGLGRQFSYSCPNTTLFQQRMLICDHWYMVNCSKAESNYAANLLIGQRDKPFVNDEENNLRTPRPDLLDRPYAPDYSGESFRNQYKKLPAAQNQIQDSDAQKSLDKAAQASQLAPGQQRWKIPPPSRTILPPAYEPQIDTSDTPSKAEKQVRFVPTTQATTRRSTTAYTTRKSTTTAATPAPTRRPPFTAFNNAALHLRQRQNVDHDDLGTSHSTRYNTSDDFNSAEVPSRKPTNSFNSRKPFTTASTTIAPVINSPVKVPSKIYEPPFLYPIYNLDDTPSTQTPLSISTATPFTAPATKRTTTTSTTTRPPSRPTTLAGKPFTTATFATTSAAASQSNAGRNKNNLVPQDLTVNTRFDAQKLSKDARTPTPAQGFKPPTPRPPVHTAKVLQPAATQKQESSPFDYKIPTTSRLNLPTPFISSASTVKSELPSNDLLPPYADIVQYDIATTQGPPIYYEWKVPSNGLEPPKLDPPIGVDGREYPETITDYNSLSVTSNTKPATPFGIDQQKSPTSTSTKNSFVREPVQQDTVTSRTPTSRSIKETAQPNSVGKPTSSKTKPGAAAAPSDITQIRKDLSVPEYSFPLEDLGRTGYLDADTYNSFRLKIPERRIDTDEHLHWFGENPKCPECHPSYVKPGTCEPCLRR